MVLKFYTSMGKKLKFKVRQFLCKIYPFLKVTGQKLVEGEAIFPLPHPKLS